MYSSTLTMPPSWTSKATLLIRKGGGVVFGKNVDGKFVSDAVATICDSEDSVIPGGVAVRAMIDHDALSEILDLKHESFSTFG